jgi:hypothetical protein
MIWLPTYAVMKTRKITFVVGLLEPHRHINHLL